MAMLLDPDFSMMGIHSGRYGFVCEETKAGIDTVPQWSDKYLNFLSLFFCIDMKICQFYVI